MKTYYRGKKKHIDIMSESSHILLSPDNTEDLEIMCVELGIIADTRDEKIVRVNERLSESNAICRFRDGHKGERFYTPTGTVCATTSFNQAKQWARHQAKFSHHETVVCEFTGLAVCDLVDGTLVTVIEVITEYAVNALSRAQLTRQPEPAGAQPTRRFTNGSDNQQHRGTYYELAY